MGNDIKAVIFDMGGVILRTRDFGFREAVARRLGTTRKEMEQVVFLSSSAKQTEMGKISDEQHWQNVLRHFEQPQEDYRQIYRDFFAGDEIDLEMITYIQTLKPKYQLGLLSNAWKNARETITVMHSYLHLFDVSIFSAEVGLRKPDAPIFQLILNQLGIQPHQAVFVDDFPENIAGAAALGLHAVHFQERDQALANINALLKN